MLLIALLPIFACLNVVWAQEEVTTIHPSYNIVEEDPLKKEELSMEFFKKMHGFLVHSSAYRNNTLEDTIAHVKHVHNWVAPRELQLKFPYYLSGYDFKDQPVWVAEVGRYNIREQIQKGPEAAQNLTLYTFQAVHRIIKSMMLHETPTKEIKTAFLIGDCEGLDLNQATHLPTVAFVVDLLRRYSDFLALTVGRVVGINVNVVATLAFESARPTLGSFFDNIELHGPNPAKWKAALQKWLPVKAIPTWYGGNKDYKPLQIFG